LITHCVKFLLVLALATQWSAFFMFVYSMATNLPSDIAGQIMQAASNSLGAQSQAATVASANTALAQFYDHALTVCSGILEGAGMQLSLYFYAGIIWLVTTGFVAYATMLIILAKLAVALILAVGPIFILLLIFNDTRKLFEGWLRTLINYALIPIFVYTLLALLLALVQPPLTYLQNNSGVNSAALTGVGPFALITFMATLLLQQVLNISANITGGVSLSTMGAVGQIMGGIALGIKSAKGTYSAGKARYQKRQERIKKEQGSEKKEAGRENLEKVLNRKGENT